MSIIFEKILVAIDGSDASDPVVEALFQLQLHSTTEVILTHVISNLGSNPDIAVDRPQAVTEDVPYQSPERHRDCYRRSGG